MDANPTTGMPLRAVLTTALIGVAVFAVAHPFLDELLHAEPRSRRAARAIRRRL